MIKSYFFNSVITSGEHDRTYNSEDISTWLTNIVSNGVLANPSNNLQVTPDSGLGILVKAGEGWIEGHKIKVTADENLSIEAADVTLNRIDRVVFALNRTDREMQIYVKTGTPASTPVAPSLSNTDNLHELSLATISVPKQTSTITSSLITDTRMDNNVCGFVHALITQVDTSTLYTQYQDALNTFTTEETEEFTTWFEAIKDTLASATLFREYKETYASTTANQMVIPIPVSDLHYNSLLDVLHIWINGFRLVENIEYTVDNEDNTITLTNGLDEIGTIVEFSNWKSVDGSEAESVVGIVDELEEKVDDIYLYRYDATGTNDNVALMNMINNYFAGTGSFSGISAYANAKIEVNGTINITEQSTVTLVENGDNDLNAFLPILVPQNSQRRLTLDFSNAIINVSFASSITSNAIIEFVGKNQLRIENIRMQITDTAGQTMSITAIETDSDISRAFIRGVLYGTTTLYGVKSSYTSSTFYKPIIIDVECQFTSETGSSTTLRGFDGIAIFENCQIIGTSTNASGDFYGYRIEDSEAINCRANITGTGNAVGIGLTNSKAIGCNSVVNASMLSTGYYGSGSISDSSGRAYTDSTTSWHVAQGYLFDGKITNSDGTGINAGAGNGYGFTITNNNGVLILVGCNGKGYSKVGNSKIGAGVYISATATQTLSMVGCRTPQETLTAYYEQTSSVTLAGSTTGAKYTLASNVLYKAISKHSGTGNSETGTLIA